MKRGNQTHVVAMIFMAMMSISYVESADAQPSPVCLANNGNTLYRVNKAGTGAVETFPNQAGVIIAMTVVPEDVAITGCVPGDIIAFESGPNRVWRVADARSGAPSLVQIGQREPGGGASSIAFSNGQLYGITGDAIYKQFNPVSFAVTGMPIDLSTVTTVGGLAFDGDAHWYICTTTRLVHEDDPPTPAGWNVLFTGLEFGGHGIEMYEGELWAGTHRDAGHLAIGKFNMETSSFIEHWQIADTPNGSNLGFVAFAPEIHRGDCNCDGEIDGTDIQAFVTALLDPGSYVAAFPECHVLNCDLNGDNSVDAADVSSFVQCLLNECA